MGQELQVKGTGSGPGVQMLLTHPFTCLGGELAFLALMVHPPFPHHGEPERCIGKF